MNRPEGAADRVAPAGTAGQHISTASLAEPAEVGKQAALARLGEILAAMPKATGGKPYQATGSEVEPVDRAPTIADLGIDKKVRP